MKIFSTVILLFTAVLFLGCETTPLITNSSPGKIIAAYAPAKVEIMPLTEFNFTIDPQHIKVYLSLSDSFGSRIKAPGKFRFELYEYVPRSAKPKGKRIAIWPDYDLTDPSQNNRYWKDFLRSYEFKLDLDSDTTAANYILQSTCLCPAGRRLSDEFTIRLAD